VRVLHSTRFHDLKDGIFRSKIYTSVMFRTAMVLLTSFPLRLARQQKYLRSFNPAEWEEVGISWHLFTRVVLIICRQ
jgi:hypothetical protein